MSLKVALGLSVAIHLGLMRVQLPRYQVAPPQALHKIEVILEPEPAAPRAHQNRPQEAKAPQIPLAWVSSRQETAAPLPVSKSVEPAPQPAAMPSAPAGSEGKSLKVSLPPKIDLLPAPTRELWVQSGPDSSGVSLLPEREFALFQHKQGVRERLKSYLTYPTLWVQGSVRLHLTVRADGTLQEASIQEATDPRLARAALSGAQNAAPYPGFPKEMKEAQVNYDFLVQYQLD